MCMGFLCCCVCNKKINYRIYRFSTFTKLSSSPFFAEWIVIGNGIYFPRIILRPAPMFCPACEAPLFCPAWSPMMALPAANVSSENSRLFSSDGFGPKAGPSNSGCLWHCKIKENYKNLFQDKIKINLQHVPKQTRMMLHLRYP